MTKDKKPSMAGKVLKVTGAIVAAGLVGGALGIGGTMMLSPAPEPVVVTEYINQTQIKEVEVPYVVEKNVTEYVEVESTEKIDYLSERIIDLGIVDEDFEPLD